jgi:DNA-binding NarL/FixJ family response regulator
MSDGQLLALTERIYDAATGSTPWASVGQGLMTLVRARTASLMVGDSMTGEADLLYCADIPPDAVAEYRAHYRSVDLWTNRAAAAMVRDGPGVRPRVWTSGHMVPDAEFLCSEFYVDFGRRFGLRYVVGTVLPLGAAGQMPIGLHRPEGAAPFAETDGQLLECLLPHLQRALQLRHHLAAASSSALPSLAALDALSVGVLVVNDELRVLVANTAAEAMAAAGSALKLLRAVRSTTAGQTVVAATHHTDHLALTALVRATALGGSCGGAIRLRDSGSNTALALLVAPLPRRLCDASSGRAGRIAGQALILLRDLKVSPVLPPSEILRTLFSLTQAEAEVARALLGGTTKQDVAAMRGLQVSTVRTQVRAILDKTGATNLRDLERLLASLQGA